MDSERKQQCVRKTRNADLRISVFSLSSFVRFSFVLAESGKRKVFCSIRRT
jgi:hypothetical protein